MRKLLIMLFHQSFHVSAKLCNMTCIHVGHNIAICDHMHTRYLLVHCRDFNFFRLLGYHCSLICSNPHLHADLYCSTVSSEVVKRCLLLYCHGKRINHCVLSSFSVFYPVGGGIRVYGSLPVSKIQSEPEPTTTRPLEEGNPEPNPVEEEGQARTFFPESWIWAVQRTE